MTKVGKKIKLVLNYSDYGISVACSTGVLHACTYARGEVWWVACAVNLIFQRSFNPKHPSVDPKQHCGIVGGPPIKRRTCICWNIIVK